MNGLSRKEFQIVGTVMRKEREPKIELLGETCRRLEEEDAIRTREGQ